MPGAKSWIPYEKYAGILDKVFESVVAEKEEIEGQRESAPALFKELTCVSETQRDLLARNSKRYQNWALAEFLLLRCREGWTEDPDQAEGFARLSLRIAELLNVDGFRRRLLNDLKAEAWSYIGNCLRIRSNYFEAARAFSEAERLLALGSGDRIEWARLLDLKASLLGASGDYDSAESVLSEAIEAYRGARSKHLEGRALMKKAKLLRESGKVVAAVPLLKRAERLIEVEREPWLAFALKKNLIIHLIESGKPQEAQRLLPEVRELAREHAPRLERLRLLWTEGFLCKALGQIELAGEAFRQVREGLAAAGIGFDMALVSLDLAALYLETDRTEEARQLATESIPLFTSRGVHREALMAWNLFREAAERDALTLGLVQEVASRIRQSQSRPAAGGDLA